MTMAVAVAKKAKLGRTPKAYGGHFTSIIDGNGKPHRILNSALPTNRTGGFIAPLYTAICEVCGHAYSHLLGAKTVCCEECYGDMSIQRAILLQRQGVYQGASDTCPDRRLSVRVRVFMPSLEKIFGGM